MISCNTSVIPKTRTIAGVLCLTILGLGIAAYFGRLGKIPIPNISISGPEALLIASSVPLTLLGIYMASRKWCCKPDYYSGEDSFSCVTYHPKTTVGLLCLATLGVGIVAYLSQTGKLSIPNISISGPAALLTASSVPLTILGIYIASKKCCCKPNPGGFHGAQKGNSSRSHNDWE